ncbi:MAG: 3-hydroxyacyl-ACP dehydratase FabZ family protein [Candidatus Rifleibacteriota bacterium]
MRFHLVDRIEEICYGSFITGVKCITLADDVFNEHFPGYPIFPGSLIQEGLAQLAGSFFELMRHKQNLPMKYSVLSIVNKMKFRKPVEPGDRLIYRADATIIRDDYGIAKVKATCGGELVANGEMTFSFLDVPDEKLFESRKTIYNICMKNTREIKNENGV